MNIMNIMILMIVMIMTLVIMILIYSLIINNDKIHIRNSTTLSFLVYLQWLTIPDTLFTDSL